MVIESTTLDTEAKVKAIYGGTTWIQHSGYMLRGATSGVTANDAVKTGGADSVSLGITNLPNGIVYDVEYPGYGYYTKLTGGSGNKGFCVNVGTGQAHNNIPNYKSVYIWERTA